MSCDLKLAQAGTITDVLVLQLFVLQRFEIGFQKFLLILKENFFLLKSGLKSEINECCHTSLSLSL